MTEGGEPAFETLRLADAFLPDGSDTLSYGVEAFVAADRVEDAAALEALCESYLRRTVGPADCVALRHAHRAATGGDAGGVVTADRRLDAVTLPRELREGSARSGGRLLALHRDLLDDDRLDAYAERVDSGDTPGHYAVVLGVVAAIVGVDADAACRVACHGFVTGLAGAAQRLAPIGHTEVQRTLREVQPAMTDAVADSAGRDLDTMSPFAPLIDVLSADHERADRRLFAN
jgi:urease accessory protein